jgi:hypothetical protein
MLNLRKIAGAHFDLLFNFRIDTIHIDLAHIAALLLCSCHSTEGFPTITTKYKQASPAKCR